MVDADYFGQFQFISARIVGVLFFFEGYQHFFATSVCAVSEVLRLFGRLHSHNIPRQR